MSECGNVNWSIIMNGWSGNWEQFSQTAREVFGRDGLDCFSLTLGAHEHLPAELAHGIDAQMAESIASRLRLTGAIVEVIPLECLPPLRHYAKEVWADRCVDGFCFNEVDGLIFMFSNINARESMVHVKPNVSSWQIELAVNHVHPGVSLGTCERIEREKLEVSRIREALRIAYPERRFTIAHYLDDCVTFWQTTDVSPRTKEELIEMTHNEHTGICDIEFVFVNPDGENQG
ncbi:MAG: hypothetical protein ACYC0V_15800 [Armatimonadota bacterium]